MVPTCSVRIPRVPTYSLYPSWNIFAYKPVTFFGTAFQPSSANVPSISDTRAVFLPPLRAPPLSLATTHGIVFTFFSSGYWDVSVPRVPFVIPIYSVCDNVCCHTLSSLIRISADLRIFAPPRSFSQLVTSFFGAMYLGILRMLFVAWSFLSIALSLSFYLLVSTKILHSNSTNLL